MSDTMLMRYKTDDGLDVFTNMEHTRGIVRHPFVDMKVIVKDAGETIDIDEIIGAAANREDGLNWLLKGEEGNDTPAKQPDGPTEAQ